MEFSGVARQIPLISRATPSLQRISIAQAYGGMMKAGIGQSVALARPMNNFSADLNEEVIRLIDITALTRAKTVMM
jgi:hypothetical protein